MAKRDDGLVELIALLPWWVNLLLAPLAYVLVSEVAPAALRDGLLSPAFAQFFTLLGMFLAGLFVLGAGFSFFNVKRKQRLLERQTGLDSIRALGWREFEELVAEAYRRDGYHVIENEGAGPDGGVDVRLRKDGELHLVQCKNWRNRSVGVRTVREMYGVLTAENASQVIIVCSGYFTGDARQFATGKPIRLVDGEALLTLVRGVQRADGNTHRASECGLAHEAAKPANICPRCGGGLVLRTAKRGQNAGHQFLGCETYPRCRYTEDMPSSAAP